MLFRPGAVTYLYLLKESSCSATAFYFFINLYQPFRNLIISYNYFIPDTKCRVKQTKGGLDGGVSVKWTYGRRRNQVDFGCSASPSA